MSLISRSINYNNNVDLYNEIKNSLSEIDVFVSGNKSKKDVDTLNLETNLSFQTKFRIKIEQDKSRSSGKLIFNYNNLDELDKICEFIYSK